MNKTCQRVRSLLVESSHDRLPAELRAHLGDCAACRLFAERADAARGLLRDHVSEFEPDPAFATRVSARLNGTAPLLMGQVALRLMPAALALVAVLAFAAFFDGSGTDTVVSTDYDDDLLEWVLEVDEGA